MYSKLILRFSFIFLFYPSSIVYAETVTEPHLGKNLTKEEINFISITVFPDGEGLPQGSGTAKIGEQIYNGQCAYCHGVNGNGNKKYHVPALAGKPKNGSDWSTGSAWPYATSIFDYIRRAMPPHSVKKFAADEVYALTAYVLKMNGFVDEKQVINQENLSKIEMPARKYFRNKWDDEEQYYQLHSYSN